MTDRHSLLMDVLLFDPELAARILDGMNPEAMSDWAQCRELERPGYLATMTQIMTQLEALDCS